MRSEGAIWRVNAGLVGAFIATLLLLVGAYAVPLGPPETANPLPTDCGQPEVYWHQDAYVEWPSWARPGFTETSSKDSYDNTIVHWTISSSVRVFRDYIYVRNDGKCAAGMTLYTTSFNTAYVTVRVDGNMAQDHFSFFPLKVGEARIVTVTVTVQQWTAHSTRIDDIARISFHFGTGYDKWGYATAYSPAMFGEVYRMTPGIPSVPPTPPPSCREGYDPDHNGDIHGIGQTKNGERDDVHQRHEEAPFCGRPGEKGKGHDNQFEGSYERIQ